MNDIVKHYFLIIKQGIYYNFFLSLILNILGLVLPIYSLQVLDRVISSHSVDTLLMLSIIALFIYAIMGGLFAVRSYVFSGIGRWLDSKLTSEVIDSIIYSTKGNVVVDLNTLLRDVGVIKNFVTGQGIITLFDLPFVGIYLIVIFFIHPVLALITFIGASILIGLAWFNERSISADQIETNQRLSSHIVKLDRIGRNLDVIKAMRMQDDLMANWNLTLNDILDKQSDSIKKGNLVSSFTRFIRMMIQLSITGIGGYLVLQFQMTAGGIIAVSILSGKVLSPFDQAIFLWRTLVTVRESYARLKSQLNENNHNQDIKLPEIKGKLEADQVFYCLGKSSEYFLKSIQFELGIGESLGIIGPSGAGKTTLSKLLVGIFLPTKGEVRLDDASIHQINRIQLRENIGYMPQQVGLFEGSIRDNICRFQVCSDEDVILAAKRVGIHEYILKLPDGYQTQVGVDGMFLSAGQRQLIGLVRACFGYPKLIVLDEPNSNLDDFGEQCLLQLLENSKKTLQTVVLISHKPSIIQKTDRTIVMRSGQIIMNDTTKKVFDFLNSPTGRL